MAAPRTNTGGSVSAPPKVKPSPNAPVKKSGARTLPPSPWPPGKPPGGKLPADS